MSLTDVTARLEEAKAKRTDAEAMKRLMESVDFQRFASIVDQVASAYVNQLIQPVPEDWKSHFLRGLVKGLDEAKTLPGRIVRMYDEERRAAEQAPAPVVNLPETMRLSPEPEEIQ